MNCIPGRSFPVENTRTGDVQIESWTTLQDTPRTFMEAMSKLHRQVDQPRRGISFAEASDPGGSRNGSTEMGW
jgi:hypothetical protein